MQNSLTDTIIKAVPPNTRFSKLIHQLWAKEATGNKNAMQEFNKECAYWLILHEDLSPLLLPTRPYKMSEYDVMTTKEKKNVPNSFWRQDDIKQYLEQKSRVEDRNRGMLDKLREFKKYIPEGDTITLAKYKAMIYEYIAP